MALLVTATLLGACSFDYDADSGAERLLEHIPETELTDATHTIVRDGRVVAEIRARQVSNFRRGGRIVLYDWHYTEYDNAGSPVTTGSAERAVYFTQPEDAALAGAIRLRSESQGVSLEADTLLWEDAHRRLVTDPETAVEIMRDDGSQVRGTGLQVDVRRKTIRFTGPVSGTLVTASTEAE